MKTPIKITCAEYDKLITELHEITTKFYNQSDIKHKVFKESESRRIAEISEILNNCKIID